MSAACGIRAAVAIPVYNHGATLRQVVERTLAVQRPEIEKIIVVDDGSTDGGPEGLDGLAGLAGLKVRLIRHPRNQGKGAAILSAARAARELGLTHLITLDADGQHAPEELPRFLEALGAEPLSIVVGARDFDTPNVPGSSRFGRSFSNFWLRVQTCQTISDSQSGFRAYPLVVFEALRLPARRYDFEVEVLVKAAWAGVPLREVPISVHYPPRGQRVSHFKAFQDNLRISLLNTKLTIRSFLPWPHHQITRSEAGEMRISPIHPIRSLRALLMARETPWNLALSSGLGVLLGTWPLLFCHTVAILFAAGYARLNKVVAVAASQLCMPPIVPALCIETGYYLRHGRFLTELSLRTLGYQALDRIWEWILGSLVLAPLLAVLVGSVTYLLSLSLRKGLHAVSRPH